MTEINNDQKRLENIYDFVMSKVATVTYQIIIHEIFNEVIMNGDIQFCKKKI